MPTSPITLEQAILHEIPSRTGIALEEWIRMMEDGPTDPHKLRDWLRDEKGLSHIQAGILVRTMKPKRKADVALSKK